MIEYITVNLLDGTHKGFEPTMSCELGIDNNEHVTVISEQHSDGSAARTLFPLSAVQSIVVDYAAAGNVIDLPVKEIQ